MGMDVYGINPKLRTEPPTIDWESKPSQEETDAYFEAKEKWQVENPGHYFRNNVWWWRPLWEFVCISCGDFMTEDDFQAGQHNDGYEIDEETAEQIVERLTFLLKVGGVKKFEEERQAHLETLPEDDFDRNYPFSVENVEEFVKFVKESGGFAIC
tara:strand:+ start:1102 stop:1566 length:465 start_codon:yes stop_codon:yes gene_type:complete